uniref:Uncharacterized protein n=1 Tax=Panagrellus redivivus TaxID=6233 RepID=A0A7E4VCQ6_PANRE
MMAAGWLETVGSDARSWLTLRGPAVGPRWRRQKMAFRVDVCMFRGYKAGGKRRRGTTDASFRHFSSSAGWMLLWTFNAINVQCVQPRVSCRLHRGSCGQSKLIGTAGRRVLGQFEDVTRAGVRNFAYNRWI